MPFPPDGVTVYKGPKVYFTKDCSDLVAPVVTAADSLYQTDLLEALSSENGVIYLVPSDTEKDLLAIRGAVLDSIISVANSPANISLSGLKNGIYWLYACDDAGNISDPKIITLLGVGIEDLNNADGLNLFPNPFSTTATLEWKADRIVQRIDLVNMLGEIVRVMDKVEGSSMILNRGGLPSGLYFLKVYGDKTFVMKVLVE